MEQSQRLYRKTTSQEDAHTKGRRHHGKTTSQENKDKFTGRRPSSEMTSQEDDLTLNKTSKEDNQTRR